MKIKAAIAWRAGAPLEIAEVELDEPRQDEILVRVVAVGVCHTDMNARDQRLPVQLPMILGHEGAGVVEATGSAVSRVAPGDTVLLTSDHCGRCRRCRIGQTAYCDRMLELTFAGVRPDGSPRAHRNGTAIRAAFFGQSSFATHALATERNVQPVPPDAPLPYVAALTCGVPTGAGAVLNAMPVGAGSTLAVFGAGAVGLGALMAAVAAGASEIVVVDRVAQRLALATELGATVTIDTAGGGDIADIADIAEDIRSRTAGGCDVALDTTGDPAVIRAAVESLGARGTCGVVAGSGSDITVPAASLVHRGRALRGIVGGDGTAGVFLPRLLDLYRRGRFPVHRLVRHYPFGDINRAIDDALAGAVVKPVLTFPDTDG